MIASSRLRKIGIYVEEDTGQMFIRFRIIGGPYGDRFADVYVGQGKAPNPAQAAAVATRSLGLLEAEMVQNN